MYFAYSPVAFDDITLADGTESSGFTASDSIPNEQSLMDGSTSLGADFDANDAVRYNFGSAQTLDFFAVNFGTSASNVFSFYRSSSSNGSSSTGLTINLQATLPIGWDVSTISVGSGSSQYWFFYARGGAMSDMREALFLKKLTFDTRPDTSIAENRNARTNINEAYSGKQYAQRLADTKKSWTLTWSNISSSFKDDLITMRDIVSLDVPFLFNDDSNSYFVRMASGLDMTEVAHQRFSTSINLIEQ